MDEKGKIIMLLVNFGKYDMRVQKNSIGWPSLLVSEANFLNWSLARANFDSSVRRNDK